MGEGCFMAVGSGCRWTSMPLFTTTTKLYCYYKPVQGPTTSYIVFFVLVLRICIGICICVNSALTLYVVFSLIFYSSILFLCGPIIFRVYCFAAYYLLTLFLFLLCDLTVSTLRL